METTLKVTDVNTYGYKYPSSDALHIFSSRTQRQNTLNTCLVSLKCATCVAQIILRYVIVLIIFWDNEAMKILSKGASVSSFYFLPLRYQYSPPHLFNFSFTLLVKNKDREIILKINPFQRTASFKARITVKKTTHEIHSTAYHLKPVINKPNEAEIRR